MSGDHLGVTEDQVVAFERICRRVRERVDVLIAEWLAKQQSGDGEECAE